MKTAYILFSVSVVLVVISISLFLSNNTTSHKTAVSYAETPTSYIFRASYNASQAELVEKYIDSCFSPVVIFGTTHKIKKEVITADNTRFDIKASQGSFYIKADKKLNSQAALDKLINTCMGLKNVIKPI